VFFVYFLAATITPMKKPAPIGSIVKIPNNEMIDIIVWIILGIFVGLTPKISVIFWRNPSNPPNCQMFSNTPRIRMQMMAMRYLSTFRDKYPRPKPKPNCIKNIRKVVGFVRIFERASEIASWQNAAGIVVARAIEKSSKTARDKAFFIFLSPSAINYFKFAFKSYLA
jgi:hypothetical protein